jgi:succinate dehydrogenase / fumarate reductase cytochrome b subunit
MRIGLIGAFVLHIHSAYSLRRMIAASNPDTGFIAGNKRYPGGQDFIAANYASRTMFWTGNIVLLYIAFHLGDLTWGWWLGDEYVRGDVYHNVVESMSSLPIAIIYVIANVALAIHIYHGAWSLFQSLGINNPRFNGALRAFATGISVLILVGNLSFPIAVQTGLLDEDGCDGSCLPIDEDQDQGESAGGS